MQTERHKETEENMQETSGYLRMERTNRWSNTKIAI